MTRDEAKEILAGRYIVNIDGEDEYCNKVNEAIDMAIEALSNQQKWIDEELQNYLIEHADLVTCKECVHAEVKEEPIKGMWCTRFGLHDMAVGDNCFCSWAERREP